MINQARILITGDFCPVNRISDLILHEKFEAVFNDFLPVIKDKELSITNLECPLTDTGKKINKYGPLLKGSINTAKALSIAGFKLVTLANNHIMDYGINGLQSTIGTCKKNSIDYVGAGENYYKARQIYYAKVGNHNVAILNFAENEFSTTHGNFPGANPFDLVENFRDISEAKANADYVIVIFHGGHEMFDLPSPRIKNTFHFYVEAGASAIFAHHAHCYSGYEIYKGAPIFHGLGNFIFDNPDKQNSNWNSGFAIEVVLDNKLNYNIIPYMQCDQHIGIKLMDSHEKELFYDNISRLNSIILNDELLNIEFEKYCNRVRKMYFSFLEPHSNKFLHFLRNRKLFPSLISKNKMTLYLNLIRCESHREIIINLLDKRESVTNN
jgi:poly-gamma-glutamate synthesis protein (capsule biosynthesis protein)